MALSGKVKSWNDNKGYGFIIADGGSEDIFVHRNELSGCEALAVGDNVQFDTTNDEKTGKRRAQNVTGGTGTKGAGKGGARGKPGPPGPGTHHGVVKSWNDERGFGFIGEEGQEEDAFVHRNDLYMCEGLVAGDKVAFDRVFDDQKGKWKAVKVSGGSGINNSRGGGPGGGQPGGGKGYGGPGAWDPSAGWGGSASYGGAYGGPGAYGGGYGGGYGAGGYGASSAYPGYGGAGASAASAYGSSGAAAAGYGGYSPY